MRLWILIITAVALVVVLVAYATRSPAALMSAYNTGKAPASGPTSVTGTENSAVVFIAAPGTSQNVLLVAVQNYGASAEVAMLFDASALPANGAIPVASCAVPAGSANAPGQCSFSWPGTGRPNSQGIVVACSTTGKTLTVDATAGGNCYFQVLYQ